MTNYQDVGDIRGFRAIPCAKSWELIRPHIKPGRVVLDIGCDLGWFTRAAADRGALAVGFEPTLKAEAVKLAQGYPLILAKHKVTLDDLKAWSEIPATIDTVLLLNVLHYLAFEEASEWVRVLGQFVPTLIVEMPNTTEDSTIGHIFHGRLEELMRSGYDDVELLGSNPVGPTHDRQVWIGRRARIDHGPLVNNFLPDPNARGTYSGPRHRVTYDGTWRLHKRGRPRRMIRGLSLYTLLHFDVRYPSREWFAAAAVAAAHRIHAKRGHIDNVHPISFLWLGDRLTMIDCDGDDWTWRDQLEQTRADLLAWRLR